MALKSQIQTASTTINVVKRFSKYAESNDLKVIKDIPEDIFLPPTQYNIFFSAIQNHKGLQRKIREGLFNLEILEQEDNCICDCLIFSIPDSSGERIEETAVYIFNNATTKANARL